MTKINVTLPDRIRWLREQRGQTRREFSKMLGVSPSLVSLWESGGRKISVAHLIAMCELGGTKLDFMLNAEFLPDFKIPELKTKQHK